MSKVAHTPQLRLPEFSETLRQATLGDFGYFYYGKSAPKWSVTEDAKTPCVRYGDLYSTFGEYISEIKSHTNIPPENLKFSKGGEVLVPRVGEDPLDFANCSYLPIPNVAIGEMISVYNTKENGLFFTYYINAKLRKAFARVVEGGNVSNLYYKYLEDIKLTIPETEEQQKIASFLAAVDTKIEQLSKKQALLGEYKKGLMQQIFSQAIRFKADDGSEFPDWEDNTIDKALHSYKLGGNYSNSEAVTDYPLIKMGNLDRGNIKLNKLQYINTEENIDDSDKINYGDLFFNTRNTLDLVGKVAIWRDELPCAYYNSNLMKMEFSDNFFMNYRFNSFDGIKALRRVATGTTSVAAIYTKDLLKIKFSLPTLSEQQKIANFLSSIDNKIEQVGEQLDESKQFKKALLQQMFV